ncbi:MAG TPA: TonB-dependent siderophore receptor [Methylomirabilota bacterium]|nr:TonB-dependent siderophore receptor [Methylomirabilota bacterium]
MPTLGVGLLVASSAPVYAQATDKDDVKMPGVDVKGQRQNGYKVDESSNPKLPDSVQDTPQSITIVPLEVMREQAAFSLRDALRNVSGVSIAAGEGGGAQGDNLTLRGFSARNDIFVDGIRDFGMYSRDTFNLESVEVLKGPSAVIFGRGSTGGAINQVSKSPSLTPSRTLSLTSGYGPTVRGTADINQPLGDTSALRLNLLGYYNDVVDRDEIWLSRFGIAPSYIVGLGTPTQFSAYFYYTHDEGTPDYGYPYVFGKPPDVPRANNYGLANQDFERDDVFILTLRLDHAFNDAVKMRNALRVAYYHREAAVSPPAAITASPGTDLSLITVTRGHTERDQRDYNFTEQTDFTFRFDTWGLKHTLVAGLEFAYEIEDVTRWAFNNIPTTNLIFPDPLRPTNMARTTNFRGRTEAFSFGVYFVDEIQITSWLKIMGGLRFDHFDTDFENKFLRQQFSQINNEFGPRAALIFQPTPQQTYYFSYGTSYNPSAEGLALAINTVQAEPEKNTSYEIGAKWDLFGNRLALATAVFQIDKTNARTTDPLLGVQINEGEQRVRGVEVSAVGTILPSWNIFTGYTFLDSEVIESKDVASGIAVEGKRIPNVAKHTATLWTTWDITPQWQVGGGAFYSSSRYANNINTNKVPWYVRGDLTAAYRPIKSLELRGNIISVSDERYTDAVHPNHNIPGTARTYLLTATWSF